MIPGSPLLDAPVSRHDRRMRLYGVRDLHWQGGRFYIHIRCYACARRNCFTAERLLHQHFAPDQRADLESLKRRLRCSACNQKKAVAWSMSEPMEFGPDEFDDLIDFQGTDPLPSDSPT